MHTAATSAPALTDRAGVIGLDTMGDVEGAAVLVEMPRLAGLTGGGEP
jgi:hypothetical protein